MDKMALQIQSEKSFEEISNLLEKTSPDKGFRVLAVHNVQKTLSEKGFQIKPLKIFEVCNAGFAYEALQSDIRAAMFMPCKIIVRPGESSGTNITLVRPSMIADLLPESDLDNLANDVERKLVDLIETIG